MFYQDALFLCDKLYSADHTTLVDFAVGYGYSSFCDTNLAVKISEINQIDDEFFHPGIGGLEGINLYFIF